jgi:hypothetical protein
MSRSFDELDAMARAAKARADAATGGPWEATAEDDGTPVVFRPMVDVAMGAVQVIMTADWGTDEDAEFIAAARVDVPAMADALLEMTAEARRLRAIIPPSPPGTVRLMFDDGTVRDVDPDTRCAHPTEGDMDDWNWYVQYNRGDRVRLEDGTVVQVESWEQEARRLRAALGAQLVAWGMATGCFTPESAGTQLENIGRACAGEMPEPIIPAIERLKRERSAALADVERLRAALLDQIARWEELPCGVDHDARAENLSPPDATAHVAGLAVRAANEALGGT